jgi:DNA-binding transcriptional MerR regulator
MTNDNIQELEQTINNHGITLQAIEKVYPKLYEPIMNLSITGVPARTYFYWKKSGLIESFGADESKKGWIKINLIEYLWIKIIVILRDYGVPFEKIKETKEKLFSNYMDILITEKDDYIEFLRESKFSEEKIREIIRVIDLVKEEVNSSPEEFEIYQTLIGNLVMGLLLKNDKGYITLSKGEDEYDVGYFSIKTMAEFESFVEPYFEKPCLFIPIRSIIEEFLDDDKTEKTAVSINLLDLKEMKVIEAIRKRDFKEITIKLESNKEAIIIEIEKDGNILDQKAKEVKRILGLNEYSEVTIKFRNDKNLYFKNKTRI